jgi:D-serine deaminase-like pyridoxal phosphate-dependent protein
VDSLSAEHTIFSVSEGGPKLSLGERVTVVPPYSDASMLLHRNIYAVRDGMVEDVWSLEGTIGLMQ